MIQSLFGHWKPWAAKNSSSSPSQRNLENSEIPPRPETPDSFFSCVEEPTFSESFDKLPGGTKARQTLSQTLLFDALDSFNNREQLLPGDFEGLHDAYSNLKSVLSADAVKEILNTPINKNGDYPLDLAAQSGKLLAMKLLADSGARTIKTWDSLEHLRNAKGSKEQKSQLHENKSFMQLMAMMKLSPGLGEVQDESGNSLPHYLLREPIPEKIREPERSENWQKTLKLLTDSDVRLNLPNHSGVYPMDGVQEYKILYTNTYNRLWNAGARSHLQQPQQSEFHKALFDKLTLLGEYQNRNPGRAEKHFKELEGLLQTENVKQLLNQADEYGNFPLDYAAQFHNLKAMQLLAQHGAKTLKSWNNVSFLAPAQRRPSDYGSSSVKDYKSRLHENEEFREYLNLIKQSKDLGRLKDQDGNTLLHYLLKESIPEKNSEPERNENWQKTLKALLKCPINLNMPNAQEKTPLAFVHEYKILYPETYQLLTKAGAKISVTERPELHTGW